MNAVIQWWWEHGKDTIESLGVVFGLCFTAASFRADARERRIANLMEMAASHRELWLQLVEKPELARVLKAHVDLHKAPVSVVEERFVHLLVTHLAVCFAAAQSGLLPSLSGLEDDVRDFFALPIPREVWKWSRKFQEQGFVHFVEQAAGMVEPPLKRV